MNGLFSSRAGRLLMFVGLLFARQAQAQYTNGIYAEFNTSMGSYTCRLEYALAPKTVANFIGLATGQRSWLETTTGLVRTNPFYNGLIFHRVITNFVNQAGSPNGLGTDGPGYVFEDEFKPSLRHTGFGVLSMANSGKDSNGSQWFITVSTQTQLNDVHSVFGVLYGGSNVVYAINRVATDASSKPLTNVVINSVVIRRVGTAAAVFDITTNGLPVVTNLYASIARAGTNVSLSYSNRLNADNRLFVSSNLVNWSQVSLGVETSSVGITNVSVRGMSGPNQFYRMAQVQYSGTLFPPRSLAGRVVTLVFTNGANWTIQFLLGTNGSGNYAINGFPGVVFGSAYGWDAFNSQFFPLQFSAPLDADLTASLNFDTAAAGGFKATVYPPPIYYYPPNPGVNTNAFSVSGSFSIGP